MKTLSWKRAAEVFFLMELLLVVAVLAVLAVDTRAENLRAGPALLAVAQHQTLATRRLAIP